MSWTERQQKMLQAMGLRVWTPPEIQAERPADMPSSMPTDTVAEAPQPAARAERAPNVRVRAPVVAVPAAVAVAAALPSTSPGASSTSGPDVSAFDAPALTEAIAACRACALCEGRRQSLWGVGHAQAHWMVVGEAPSELDDQCNEPFAAPASGAADRSGSESGMLLDNMLRALGLTRQAAGPERQVFITHALRCRPSRDRSPGAAEVASCRPYLKRQIELTRPRIILALGRLACQALLDTQEPLGKLRGRVHRVGDVPVVVSYAPSYLLRNPAEKARAWEDLCLAMRTLQGGSA
ncbi:MAG: uracil-DNA glycosylase [Burkholderiaceae bacterium]|nr:uracil-DNA glycosylase [Roseateles sp.]MBV8471320.1 uracil-DNA glycosylase [Burkholderiaceae bacterium]